MPKIGAEESFASFLERQLVNFLYLDESSLGWLQNAKWEGGRGFVEGRVPADWELLAAGNEPGDRWRIYHRVK
ncbi:MAG: hypothetical protein U0792_25460 [Gemmataceae bacterium]